MNHKALIHRLLVSQLISSVGDQLTLVASFVTLYSTTGDAITAASPLLVRGIVQLTFGIVSMHLVDKYRAKSLAVLSDLIRFLLIGAIVLAPNPGVVFILTIQALSSFIEIFFNSSREKMFNAHVDTLPKSDQNYYIALDNQVLSFTEIFGFALGFALTVGFSFKVAFGIDAATFLASSLIILSTGDISLRSTPSEGFGEIFDGFRITFGNADLKRMTMVRAFFWLGAGVFNVVVIELLREGGGTFNPASTAALARSLEAIGFTVGLWGVKKLLCSFSGRSTQPASEMQDLFRICAIGLGIAAATVFGLIPNWGLALLFGCFFIHGIGTGYNSFGIRRIRQLATAGFPAFRGRVNTLSNTIAKFSEVVGMLIVLAGGRLHGRSVNYVLLASGAFLVLATGVALFRTELYPDFIEAK